MNRARWWISDSFVHTSDDCITVYNDRGDYWGSSRDITVRDTTLWADVAHAIIIIDVLEHDEDDPEFESVIGIMAGAGNLVRDVVVDGMHVEHIQEGKLFSFHIVNMAKCNISPGRGIENITLRNVSHSGKGSPGAASMAGYDAAVTELVPLGA